jgi:uncharacterized protein YkwD
MGPVTFDNDLTKASTDHVKNMGKTGAIGHIGLDGSSPFDRLQRYTSLNTMSGENIHYGDVDPQTVIV